MIVSEVRPRKAFIFHLKKALILHVEGSKPYGELLDTSRILIILKRNEKKDDVCFREINFRGLIIIRQTYP